MNYISGFILVFWLITLSAFEDGEKLKDCLAPATIFTAESQDWELIKLRFHGIFLKAKEAQDLSESELAFLKGVIVRLEGAPKSIDQNDGDFLPNLLPSMEFLLKGMIEHQKKTILQQESEQRESEEVIAPIIGQISNEILIHDMSHFTRIFFTLEDLIYADQVTDKESYFQLISQIKENSRQQTQIRKILREFLLQKNVILSRYVYQELKDKINEGYFLGLNALELMKQYLANEPELIAMAERDLKECMEFLSMLQGWEKEPASLRSTSLHAYNESLMILDKLHDFMGFNITVSAEEKFNLKLKIAAHELYYLFFTFFDNAKDAKSPDRDLQLKVDLSTVEKGIRTFLKIEITDNGKGMTPKVLQTLSKGIRMTTKGKMGSGVGLESIRNLIHSLDGFMEIQSSPGQGTTFTLFIPGDSFEHPNQIYFSSQLLKKSA